MTNNISGATPEQLIATYELARDSLGSSADDQAARATLQNKIDALRQQLIPVASSDGVPPPPPPVPEITLIGNAAGFKPENVPHADNKNKPQNNAPGQIAVDLASILAQAGKLKKTTVPASTAPSSNSVSSASNAVKPNGLSIDGRLKAQKATQALAGVTDALHDNPMFKRKQQVNVQTGNKSPSLVTTGSVTPTVLAPVVRKPAAPVALKPAVKPVVKIVTTNNKKLEPTSSSTTTIAVTALTKPQAQNTNVAHPPLPTLPATTSSSSTQMNNAPVASRPLPPLPAPKSQTQNNTVAPAPVVAPVIPQPTVQVAPANTKPSNIVSKPETKPQDKKVEPKQEVKKADKKHKKDKHGKDKKDKKAHKKHG